MTTTTRRTGTENAPPSAPFSYAQAVKTMATPPVSAPASKQASGTITPAKDAASPPAVAPAARDPSSSWADDADAEANINQESSSQEVQINGTPPPAKSGAQPLAAIPNITSPERGASSVSTATKEDDVMSIQNHSAESNSTWENKSQASNAADKPTENGDSRSEKSTSTKADKSANKPLQEAPLPPVNIWKQRADEAAKAKAAQKAPAAKTVSNASSQPQMANGASRKKSKGGPTADDVDTKDKSSNETIPKPREEEKAFPPRKDEKFDQDLDKSRRGVKGRSGERENKSNTSVTPLLPNHDQESWPTPVTATDEDRRKAQEREERNDRDRNVPTSKTNRKEWKTIPITPTVVFNTPLPTAGSVRKGGRGGNRAGAQNGGRPAPYGASHFDKDAPGAPGLQNGDQTRRGRVDGSVVRDSSPNKGRRTVSAGSLPLKDTRVPINAGDKGPEGESGPKRATGMPEPVPGQQSTGAGGSFPRQFGGGRPNKGRRGDAFVPADKRKDGDLAPPKDQNAPFDRRTSTATQQDGPEDTDRRASAVHDGQASHQKSFGGGRQVNGTFSSRGERSRGGGRGRGGNHGYHNGGHHAFANGPVPSLQPSPAYSLPQSPTALRPDQAPYFVPGAQNGRNFRANGPRSQSVTTDSMYNRPPAGYPGAPPAPIAPVPGYGAGIYDYPIMPPMSAVQYGPFVDPYTVQNMVTMQLEYYFSVENLIKDIFLRKHMDSKGFVFLSVIAEFNRIKHLTKDLDLIKSVCYHSPEIEWRVGADGKDRLRRKTDWERWVLNMAERDPSAQNDGQEKLHIPPVPHMASFDTQFAPRYAEAPAGSPPGPMSPTNNGPYQHFNGVHDNHQNVANVPTHQGHGGQMTDDADAPNQANDDASHKGSIAQSNAVNGEADSFSDQQVENLSVIVRAQDGHQELASSLSATQESSNGTNAVNGTGPLQG